MTGVDINGQIIEMKDTMEDVVTIFGSIFGIFYGICLIFLGIILAIVTYRYVFPIGSILLILNGLILIFWKRWIYMVRGIILGYENKEIKE